jgi:hypothetical protein
VAVASFLQRSVEVTNVVLVQVITFEVQKMSN